MDYGRQVHASEPKEGLWLALGKGDRAFVLSRKRTTELVTFGSEEGAVGSTPLLPEQYVVFIGVGKRKKTLDRLGLLIKPADIYIVPKIVPILDD